MQATLERNTDNLLFAPPELGTVLYLPGLPGGGSKIYDRSPYGNIGTITGATWKRLPNGLWYLYYDGADDYTDLGSSFQSVMRGSFTILMWVKPDDGQPAVVQSFAGDNNAAGEDRINFQLGTDGTLGFYYESDNNQCRAKSAGVLFSNGQEKWHLVGAVLDSVIGGVGGSKLNFDGVNQSLDGTDNGDSSGVTFADWTSTDTLTIGCYHNNGTFILNFAGGIALLKLIAWKLTELDFQNIYHEEKHLFGVW